MRNGFIIILLVMVLVSGGFVFAPTESAGAGGQACTMEAKVCPDGTTVGRNSDNNCEFYPCPSEENNVGPEEECKYYYWFDEQSLRCGYKKFCGLYMYQGLWTFETYEECEKALSLITEKCCPPKCLHVGSRSEGWYDSCTGERIAWATCSGCEAVCKHKGSRSEGWYAECKNPANEPTASNFGSLIKWDCGGCADNYTVPAPGTGSGTSSGGAGYGVTSTSTTSQIVQPNIVISTTGGTGGGATYSVGVCTGDQPEECTQEYAPVCATIVHFNPNGEYNKYRKTFSNACMACASSTRTDTVTGYVNGECEQDTDMECPQISKPVPGYCPNGEIVPVYKEYNGVKCLVGYECRKKPEEPVDNLPVFIYTESNASARTEKVFKLYRSGAMVETITQHFGSETGVDSMKRLKGEISQEEVLEFLAKLETLGFFEIGYLKDCTWTYTHIGGEGAGPANVEGGVCPVGAANHKVYARYNNKENKLGWYNGLHETPEAIGYALDRLEYFEELLEGTPDQSEKYVKLGEAFDLYMSESAKVRETGFKVKLERIEAGMAMFSVSPPYIGAVEEEEPVKGEFQGKTGVKIQPTGAGAGAKGIAISSVSTGTSVGAKTISISSVSGSHGIAVSLKKQRWVKIAVGEQGTVYGHTISLNNVLFPECMEATADTGETVIECVGAKPFANLTITKYSDPSNQITAYLGKKFAMREGDYAKVLDEAGRRVMGMSLEGILIPVDCGIQGCEVDPETGVEVCPMIWCDMRPTAKLLVSILPQQDGGGQPGGPEISTLPQQGGISEMIMVRPVTIREGESKAVGSFNIYFADLIGNKAVFVVSKVEEDIPYQEVELGEDFKLRERQTALIVEKDIFVTLMRVNENPVSSGEINVPPSIYEPLCDEEGVAGVYYCQNNEKKVVYNIPGKGSVFHREDGTTLTCPVVAPDSMSEECRKLIMEEEYCKEVNICEDVYTHPGYAVVSVWKKGWGVAPAPVPVTAKQEARVEKIKENIRKVQGVSAVQTVTAQITPSQVVPYKKTYTLGPGQTLKIYDIRLTLNAIGEKSAEFVANELTYGNTINVHVGEPFKLREDMSARVLGANMRIDLLNIVDESICTLSYPAQCFEKKFVKIGVSHLLFEKKKIGQAVSSAAISENIKAEIVEEATAEQAVSSTTLVQPIELPPTPFRVFTLGEGESASVGDFEIMVLAIWSEHAEFTVKEKSTGIQFKLVLGKGWNLYSLPGEIRTIGSNECQTSEFRLFGYLPGEKRFVKVLKPELGRAYWLYNAGSECTAEAELVEPVSIYELDDLYKGWNFVPVLQDMLGAKVGEMGDCKLKGAFFFNNASGSWEKALDTILGSEHLGKALAVFATEKCSLVSTGIPMPEIPELPELPEVE